MAEITLVFVEGMLFAPKSAFVFQFRMAEPTTIFVPGVLRAPEAAFVAFGSVADETGFARHFMTVRDRRIGYLSGVGRSCMVTRVDGF